MRVVIAEDSVLLREGLVGMLPRFGFDVVAAVGDAGALVAAVDGTLIIDSPPGGPTVIGVELPCES